MTTTSTRTPGLAGTAPRSARRRPLVSHGSGFLVVALAFATAMAFSTVPTPLYPLYQVRDGLPTVAVTVVFAAYAVGVAASLYLVGHLSDRFGRRRVLLLGLAAQLVAAVLFLALDGLGGLVVARLVSGAGIGAVTATATAHLAELRAVARPDGPRDASAVAGLANIGGLALGPLVGGLLAQAAPAPLATPYVAFIVLLAAAVLAAALVPETVSPSVGPYAYRPQRVAVPQSGRSTFVAAAAAAFAGFAVFGLFTSLTPSVLSTVMHEDSRLVAGLVSAAVFASAALAQLASGRLAPTRQVALAVGLTLTGLVVLAVSVGLASLPGFVASAVVAGAGVGILFRGALATAGSLAEPQRRGEVLAGIFLVAYVGLAVPVLLLGLSLTVEPLRLMVVVFAAATAVLVALAAPGLARRSARG
ncbi:MFS transporter [Cellulosimicrobium cellulans]|uniref:MFS transporter n=1 Tax=Cellulosimicrobium cellulans TaxID=1710 RepID=UPI001EDAA36D|nr:MFS transporter [Cellulosimicrobium cellulans]UKJ64819.1 MFS transporter [Cellulosimicrobium cellulans]